MINLGILESATEEEIQISGISEYKFENNLLDDVGANDGVGVDITYEPSIDGLGAVFNGSTSEINIGNSLDFSFTNGITDLGFVIEFDYKESSNKNAVFIYKGGLGPEYQLKTSGSYIEFQLISTGDWGTNLKLRFDYVFQIGVWTNLRFVYDGSGTIDGMQLYINDVLQILPSNQSQGVYIGMTILGYDVLVGRNAGGNFLDGMIDNLKIEKYT